jgi:hypothetical protein
VSKEMKEIIDLLISCGHWQAAEDIGKEYGSEIRDYVYAHEDCPW